MIVDPWKEAFLRTVQHYENAGQLRAAALDERLADWTAYLKGETYVVVGSRNDSATFPYGFFKWWQLDKNTGHFNIM